MHDHMRLKIKARKREHRRAHPAPTLRRVPEHKQLSELEHARHIRGPHESLLRFQEGKQTAADWYLLNFRIRFGLYAAVERFHGETEELMSSAHQLMQTLLARYRKLSTHLNTGWTVSTEELEIFTRAVKATDWMQIQLERKAIERFTHKVHKEMIRHVQ